MFDLQGKKALITGSTQGIGFAFAKCLAEAGATVFINGTNEEKANQASTQIDGSQIAVCDLSLPDCADRLYEKTGTWTFWFSTHPFNTEKLGMRSRMRNLTNR